MLPTDRPLQNVAVVSCMLPEGSNVVLVVALVLGILEHHPKKALHRSL